MQCSKHSLQRWSTTFTKALSSLIASSFRTTISSQTLLPSWSKEETLDLAVSGSQPVEKTPITGCVLYKRTIPKFFQDFLLKLFLDYFNNEFDFIHILQIIYLHVKSVSSKISELFCNYLDLYFLSYDLFSYITTVNSILLDILSIHLCILHWYKASNWIRVYMFF